MGPGQILEWVGTLGVAAVIVMLVVTFGLALLQIIRENWRD